VAPSAGPGTLSTGQGALRNTRSVTEPSSSRSNPVRPRVPRTTRSLRMAFAWATISDAAWPSTTSRSNGTAVPSGTKRDRAARSSSRSSGVRVMGGSISGTAGAIGTSARTWSSVTVASYQPAMATACSTARCENSEKSTGQSIRLISIILAPRGCDTLGGGTTSTGTFAARTMVCAVDPKSPPRWRCPRR